MDSYKKSKAPEGLCKGYVNWELKMVLQGKPDSSWASNVNIIYIKATRW